MLISNLDWKLKKNKSPKYAYLFKKDTIQARSYLDTLN